MDWLAGDARLVRAGCLRFRRELRGERIRPGKRPNGRQRTKTRSICSPDDRRKRHCPRFSCFEGNRQRVRVSPLREKPTRRLLLFGSDLRTHAVRPFKGWGPTNMSENGEMIVPLVNSEVLPILQTRAPRRPSFCSAVHRPLTSGRGDRSSAAHDCRHCMSRQFALER